MANNMINISTQNITLASAQRSVAGNQNGYFAIVGFYCSGTGNRPNSTGLTIKFDPRLTLLGDEWGDIFAGKVYDSQGNVVTNLRGKTPTQEQRGDNIWFAATSDSDAITNDYMMYYACVQFPADVEVGDVFPIQVLLEDEDHNACEFLYADSTAEDSTNQTDMAWTKAHLVNGGITVVE